MEHAPRSAASQDVAVSAGSDVTMSTTDDGETRFAIGDDVVIKHVTRSVLNEMIEEIQCAMKIAPIYTIQSVIRDIQGVRQNLFLNKTTH